MDPSFQTKDPSSQTKNYFFSPKKEFVPSSNNPFETLHKYYTCIILGLPEIIRSLDDKYYVDKETNLWGFICAMKRPLDKRKKGESDFYFYTKESVETILNEKKGLDFYYFFLKRGGDYSYGAVGNFLEGFDDYMRDMFDKVKKDIEEIEDAE